MMFVSLDMQYALDYIYLECASYQVNLRLMVSLRWHIFDMDNHSKTIGLCSQIYVCETSSMWSTFVIPKMFAENCLLRFPTCQTICNKIQVMVKVEICNVSELSKITIQFSLARFSAIYVKVQSVELICIVLSCCTWTFIVSKLATYSFLYKQKLLAKFA